MYSKSALLKMILENDKKTEAMKNAGPVVNISEAIHGSNKANFDIRTGVPLGQINDSEEAKQVLFARDQSAASI